MRDESVRDERAAIEAVADRLRAAVTDAARLGRLVHQSWWDARGAEYADRITLVGRELGRQIDVATELARDTSDALAAGGPLLPGTGGRRVGEGRGVQLPLLDDRDDDPR